MRDQLDQSRWTALGHQCRRVAALVMARLVPGRSVPDVLDQIAAMPVARQTGLVGAVLAVLFALALVAAQFGPLGLAVYFGAVILLVR
jgi:hypothetical protein